MLRKKKPKLVMSVTQKLLRDNFNGDADIDMNVPIMSPEKKRDLQDIVDRFNKKLFNRK